MFVFMYSWMVVVILIVFECVGCVICNLLCDVMLFYVVCYFGGYGWIFGIYEVFD